MAHGTGQHRLHDAARSLRERVVSSPLVRQAAYKVKNRQLFSDLSQHDGMLGDSVRVEAYFEAFQKHIQPGDVVVDLGTGSGVLAFFAAAAGAKKVHAIEHGPMIDAARAVAIDNGIENVEFHRMHSGSFELAEKADAIIHEQIGEAMFDERVVENVVDLRDRVLKPGGLILPALLRLYIEPVQVADHARTPFAWRQRLHGIDFRALESRRATQTVNYFQPRYRPFPFDRFLCEPEPVVSIDLHTAAAGDLPTRITYSRPVIRDGKLDGMCVYFDAGFDQDMRFGSYPDGATTSWASPLLRIDSRDVRAGDTIQFTLESADLARPGGWSWDVEVLSS